MAENKREFNIGDEIWFYQEYTGIVKATIIDFRKTMNYFKRDEEITYAYVETEDGMNTGVLLSDMHESKNACLKACEAKTEKIVKEYKDSIKDVNDLVRFMYNENVATAEEYTDWDARRAAKERALELLGIELGE